MELSPTNTIAQVTRSQTVSEFFKELQKEDVGESEIHVDDHKE